MINILVRLLLKIFIGPEKDFDLVLENLALLQQVAAMKRSIKRPQLRSRDRLYWVLLSRFWCNWQQVLMVVIPETIVRWHKKGFKLFWKINSRRKGSGRTSNSSELIDRSVGLRRKLQLVLLLGATGNYNG